MRIIVLPPFYIDLAELDIPDTIKLEFPDPSNILNFNVSIHPDEGMDTFREIGVFGVP
jgi:hypothetical protein